MPLSWLVGSVSNRWRSWTLVPGLNAQCVIQVIASRNPSLHLQAHHRSQVDLLFCGSSTQLPTEPQRLAAVGCGSGRGPSQAMGQSRSRTRSQDQPENRASQGAGSSERACTVPRGSSDPGLRPAMTEQGSGIQGQGGSGRGRTPRGPEAGQGGRTGRLG